MASKGSKATHRNSKLAPAIASGARSVKVSRQGIKTGRDFASFMSGLMSDLIEGKVPPQVGNAACNAGGKLLKIVEMQYKYGAPPQQPGKKGSTKALAAPRELTLAVGM